VEELVIFFGNTGAGKSTTINFLLGHELYKHEHEKYALSVYSIKDQNTRDPFSKIGHNTNESETIYP
jgi:Fe-S cluster assembly ATPase SufC